MDPTHPQESHCQRFLADIQAGNITGVITTFVVTEYIDVVKRLLAKRLGREPNQPELDAAVAAIEHTVGQFGIEEHDADRIALAHAGPGGLFDHAAGIVIRSGSVQGRRDGKWRSVGGADALHVSLAERVGATHYATCDQGFSRLASTTVRSAIMEDEYP